MIPFTLFVRFLIMFVARKLFVCPPAFQFDLTQIVGAILKINGKGRGFSVVPSFLMFLVFVLQ